ncbi:hypothetical protein [Patulibacter minatonensis]|uniref:hypothetical protein n=1 Tax=Patulibacter minatonensis TaxID=298163 RepID=UPI00047B8FD4|nr:hypothetical protein [Patulibacter minatonensis]
MVAIVLVVVIVAVSVFATVRAVQWMTKSGPYNTYGLATGRLEQDRENLRQEIEDERRRTAAESEAESAAADLDERWMSGDAFGPPDDGPGRRR